jgi:flavin reductase (DIM6/NTAB) family NADH-FMN oxidoreductase RutF
VAIDEADFRKAMSHFPSGVTVVTTELDGERYGMTVASFASLSLRPPLVVICIEKGTKTHDAIAGAGRFAVNFLAESQGAVSSRFASRSGDKFEGIETRAGELGVPLLDGALATIECTLQEQLPGGDHTIFVGEVVAADIKEGEPLIYFRSGYHTLAR